MGFIISLPMPFQYSIGVLSSARGSTRRRKGSYKHNETHERLELQANHSLKEALIQCV
jgi:hypothetical protein